GHSKLNLIRAKWPAARAEIFCARNLASRLVALSHPVLLKKMPAWRRVARHNVSSVREKSARSEDRRRRSQGIRAANQKRGQIFGRVRGIDARAGSHLLH